MLDKSSRERRILGLGHGQAHAVHRMSARLGSTTSELMNARGFGIRPGIIGQLQQFDTLPTKRVRLVLRSKLPECPVRAIPRDQAGEDSMELLEGGRMMGLSLVGTERHMMCARANGQFPVYANFAQVGPGTSAKGRRHGCLAA